MTAKLSPDVRVSNLRLLLSQWLRRAKRIFHIVVAFIFLILGAAGAVLCVAEWEFYRRTPAMGLLRFGLLAGFTVMLVILGLYSFARARSVR